MSIRAHQNIKKPSEFHSHLIFVVSIDMNRYDMNKDMNIDMNDDQKCKKKRFLGVFKGAHFQVPESGTLSARIQTLRPLFHANIPPNGGVGFLFRHLPLLDA